MLQARRLYGGRHGARPGRLYRLSWPTGSGVEQAKYPSLSGQHPAYIKAQLTAFRSATRDNDPNGMMRDVAKKLTDQDIEALSKYVAGFTDIAC